tara:strand:- start:446 stop:724 length:279 start_codon:yes stop_codon:yes gene_type:complete
VVVEQAAHLILVLMAAEEAAAEVSATFHQFLCQQVHIQLVLAMVERVVTHILHQVMVEPQLNQKVVEQVQYLIQVMPMVYLPLLQLAEVAAA